MQNKDLKHIYVCSSSGLNAETKCSLCVTIEEDFLQHLHFHFPFKQKSINTVEQTTVHVKLGLLDYGKNHNLDYLGQ